MPLLYARMPRNLAAVDQDPPPQLGGKEIIAQNRVQLALAVENLRNLDEIKSQRRWHTASFSQKSSPPKRC
jgi:hypothetical protein